MYTGYVAVAPDPENFPGARREDGRPAAVGLRLAILPGLTHDETCTHPDVVATALAFLDRP